MKFYRIEYGDCEFFKLRNNEQTCEWTTTKREAEFIARQNDDGDYKSRITEIDVPTDKVGLLAFLNANVWR
jgi:hypothetical protein